MYVEELEARSLIQEGSKWKIGDSSTVKVWEDNWHSAAHLPKPVARVSAQSTELRVRDLRSKDGAGWDNEMLESLFNAEEVSLIKEVPVSAVGVKDRLIWKHSKDGHYTIKTGYQVAT